MHIISLHDVWLKYNIEFKENGKILREDLWALKRINLDINKGEVIGVIGENGAGKTTLLKVIAGMLRADRGMVEVNGKVSTLMEIGAGFQQDLTGKENIYLISSLFGLTKDEIDVRYSDIAELASIGRFINAPVKSYSQGMYMRLAFAIAIHVEPDILLIDDIFSVGDPYAQHKCIKKMFELKEKGITILLVTQDLDMAKRLCPRAAFLRDGEIIKDGAITQVCNYYMETVGDKKGIAIVENGPLGVVFNNGKLILRWKDRTITGSLSGHSSMLSSGRQFLSTTADWEVQKSDSGLNLAAIGKWPDLSLSQYWKIIFLNEKEFLWETVIKTHNYNTSIERYETRLMFIDKYEDWFTLDTKGHFSVNFIHESEWEISTLDDQINRVIGLEGSNGKSGSLPTIVLDRLHDNTEMICYIGNTGYETGVRVVQYQTFYKNSNNNYIQDQYKCFSVRVKLFETEENRELELYIDNVKQILQEAKIIRKGSLSIFCKGHKVEIYWQDKLLTAAMGLNTRFRCQNKNYSALDGRWSIHKENSEKIVVTISWDDKPSFNQIWSLNLQDNNIIVLDIEMEVNERIKIRNKETELFLSGGYTQWITPEEKGNFERLEKKDNTVILNKYINEQIGVESVYKIDDFILPGIAFDWQDTIPKTSYISKIKGEIESAKLRYVEIDIGKDSYVLPGRYKYFKGRIKVTDTAENELIKTIENRPIITVKDPKPLNKIEFDKMALVFANGKGRLIWDGVELTKGLGLYSSVFFRDRWHDSSQAFWKVEKIESARLVVFGHWPWVNLSQTWEMKILDEKTIFWKITKEVWDNAILEREQVNLMLSDKYKEWSVHNAVHGEFPEIFREHNGIFWDRLWCGDTTSPIGIRKSKFEKAILRRQFLPSVVFDISKGCQARYFIIENTDNLFRARILQCELNPAQRGAFNKNKYFEGQIKIVT